MSDTLSIGARLRKARKDAGWTLKQVAEELGVSAHSVVSRWESDAKSHQDPDFPTVRKLAKLYGVPVGSLVGEEPLHDDNRGRSRGRPHPGADRAAWVDELKEAFAAGAAQTSAAIEDQKDEFVKKVDQSMSRIADVLERLDAREARMEKLLVELTRHLGEDDEAASSA